MTFKEAVASDIKAVFLNFDEFGTEHTVNGKKIVIVMDDDMSAQRAREFMGGGIYDSDVSIYTGSKTFFAAAAELGFRPVIGNNLRLDGVNYTVINVFENMGVYEITLQAYNGR